MSTILRPPAIETAAPARPSGAPAGAPRPKPDRGPFLNPPEGWLAVLGFAAAAEAVAESLAAAGWQPGLNNLPWLTGVAVVLGFLVTRGRRVNWILWVVGLLAGLVVALQIAGAAFLPTYGWAEQLYYGIGQLTRWILNSLGGRIVQENMLISLALGAFAYFWVYVSWLVLSRPRLGWLTAGLLAAPLFGNVMFKPYTGSPWLVVWAAGSLAMILSLSLDRRLQQYRRMAFFGWQSGNMVALPAGLAIAGLATAAFAFAPGVPFSPALNRLYQKLNGPIGQAQRVYEQLGVPKEYDASQIRFDTFQARLKFLGPFRPGTDLVMTVKTDHARYEQGLVFDRYDHDGWTNTRFNTFESSSNEFSTLTAQQETGRDRDRVQIAEQITMVKPAGALLFAAPQPLGANLRLRGDGFGDLRATTTIQANQQYTAASLESMATVESLQAATGPMPPAIAQSFLELPSDMPPRVKQLAQQQTAGKTNNYDRAAALEAYIRTFPYYTDTPLPPAGRDGVDWFLFDERRGYSDYSSSAMAVLLRSIGIPSRVVAGYDPGQLDPSDGTYHVTEKDTHTWTQAYFPGYGWIDFEPSPDDPAFPRAHNPRESPSGGAQSKPQPTPQQNATPTPGPGPGAAASQAGGGSSGRRSFPWWLGLVLAAIAAGAYLFVELRGKPSARLAYMRLAFIGTLLGMRPHSWQTPREYGQELQQRRRFDPSATTTITNLYTADRYGARPLDERGNYRAWTAWRYIKGRLVQPWRRPRSS